MFGFRSSDLLPELIARPAKIGKNYRVIGCYDMGSLALRRQLLSPRALHRGAASDPSSLDTEGRPKAGLLECIHPATCSRGFVALAHFEARFSSALVC